MQISILEYLSRLIDSGHEGKTAIVDSGTSYTFADLNRCAQRCATIIARRRDVIRQPIAVYLPKSAGVVFANIGIVYSGNIYTNLDIKSPAQRTSAILGNIAPALIITSKSLLPELQALGVALADTLLIEEVMDESVTPEPLLIRQRLEPLIDTDPLCIINTSGSTGVPKGVVLNHRGAIDFMDWCFDTLKLNGSERIGSLSPFHFDIYSLELNLCLAKGATLVLIPDQHAIFPAKLMEFLESQAISFLFWVPSIMVNIANQGLLEKFNLSALKDVFFAGEVFPTRPLNQWRRALPAARFVNLYGPIEINVDCTFFVLDREFADDEPIPIGFACRNTDVLILNDDNRPCAVEERGELCVRGSSLAMGYWNDPEKTAKAFVQNPLNDRYPELIYRTGDIAYRNPRGEIMYVGRKDFQIKHMGYRIELPEIEYQVLRIEGIANACVLYHKEKKEITLFYETKNSDLAPAAIRKELSAIFPKYMLPSVFHHLPELPRNPNGKIDRNGLTLQLQNQV